MPNSQRPVSRFDFKPSILLSVVAKQGAAALQKLETDSNGKTKAFDFEAIKQYAVPGKLARGREDLISPILKAPTKKVRDAYISQIEAKVDAMTPYCGSLENADCIVCIKTFTNDEDESMALKIKGVHSQIKGATVDLYKGQKLSTCIRPSARPGNDKLYVLMDMLKMWHLIGWDDTEETKNKWLLWANVSFDVSHLCHNILCVHPLCLNTELMGVNRGRNQCAKYTWAKLKQMTPNNVGCSCEQWSCVLTSDPRQPSPKRIRVALPRSYMYMQRVAEENDIGSFDANMKLAPSKKTQEWAAALDNKLDIAILTYELYLENFKGKEAHQKYVAYLETLAGGGT